MSFSAAAPGDLSPRRRKRIGVRRPERVRSKNVASGGLFGFPAAILLGSPEALPGPDQDFAPWSCPAGRAASVATRAAIALGGQRPLAVTNDSNAASQQAQ
jgi:hypothetical protein